MRRADRLFQIVQILRRGRTVTAQQLAEELEVSERTVYRDMADLIGSGVPVEGEAGVGYLLRDGYDLPPLMFTIDELEALVLGARIVQGWADPDLGRAAADVIAKVAAVVPPEVRGMIDSSALLAPEYHARVPYEVDMTALRRAVRERRKMRFAYTNEAGNPTARTVRPLAISFFGPVWVLTAWCELRNDFRNFRLDRMTETAFLDDVFRPEPGTRFTDYMKRERARC